MFETIFSLCNFSQGFIYSEVYDMPVWLRNFNLQQLIKAKEEEKAQVNSASKGSTDSGKIARGPFG